MHVMLSVYAGVAVYVHVQKIVSKHHVISIGCIDQLERDHLETLPPPPPCMHLAYKTGHV